MRLFIREVRNRPVDGATAFGEFHHALGGMFVGTYTGGSVNFNALALHYGVAENGLLYAGANVVDSGMTTIWMAITVALPRLVRPFWPSAREKAGPAATPSVPTEHPDLDDTERVHPFDLALLITARKSITASMPQTRVPRSR